jgi:hypothetical protein
MFKQGVIAFMVIVALLAGLKIHHMNLEHAYRMEMLRTATVKANEVELPQFVMTKGARR